MGDADVAKSAFRLPLTHRLQLGGNIDQIMNLHQVDALGPQSLHRALHRFNPGLLTARPNFGREEEFVAQSELRRKSSDNLLGPAVHWGRIDYPSAQFYK